MTAVLGAMSRKVVVESPPESLTVKYSRYQTFAEVSPLLGMANVPLTMPTLSSMAGWVCVSWWKSIRHVNALAGRVPSSASVPVPENESVVPPEYLAPAVGVTIVRSGAELLVIVRMPALLVTVPAAFVTTQR